MNDTPQKTPNYASEAPVNLPSNKPKPEYGSDVNAYPTCWCAWKVARAHRFLRVNSPVRKANTTFLHRQLCGQRGLEGGRGAGGERTGRAAPGNHGAHIIGNQFEINHTRIGLLMQTGPRRVALYRNCFDSVSGTRGPRMSCMW